MATIKAFNRPWRACVPMLDGKPRDAGELKHTLLTSHQLLTRPHTPFSRSTPHKAHPLYPFNLDEDAA